jgi:hypothetical protein
MMPAANEIFDKIDAIVEKHDAVVLTDKIPGSDDFPCLTEVIASELAEAQAAVIAAPLLSDCSAETPGSENDDILLEHRLCALINQQFALFEERIRQIIREECAKK